MIYFIFGPPGEGKSYVATYKAVQLLKADKKKVFTNYPVRIWDKKLKAYRYSYKWNKEYVYLDITNASVFVDEGYRDYNCHSHVTFTPDEHTFFATNRHNEVDLWILTQNPARILLIIREIVNIFYHVRCFRFPFTDRPLWFTVDGYLSENDFASRHKDDFALYGRQKIFFKKKVAKAYDTHYYRKESHEDMIFQTWDPDDQVPEEPLPAINNLCGDFPKPL